MFFIKRNHNLNAIKKLLRCYSLVRKNHYEVLNLRRNCSDKEIKEAFIQMSKEYHPDKNKDVRAQDKFVRIVEAYNVLSKPSSRARYDSMIEVESNSHAGASYMYRQHVPYNLRNHPQYSYYYESQTRTTNTNESTNTFYGFSGIKKMPNYMIIAMCAGVALIGVLLQVFVIRELYVAQHKQAQEKSKRLAEELERVRATAHMNGNELQTRLLFDKIVTAANPTVATASLGQALANEKNGGTGMSRADFRTDVDIPSQPIEQLSLRPVINAPNTSLETSKMHMEEPDSLVVKEDEIRRKHSSLSSE